MGWAWSWVRPDRGVFGDTYQQPGSPSEPLEGRLEGWDTVRGRPRGPFPNLEYPSTHTHIYIHILAPLNQKPLLGRKQDSGVEGQDPRCNRSGLGTRPLCSPRERPG